jgi:hypothetical protein
MASNARTSAATASGSLMRKPVVGVAAIVLVLVVFILFILINSSGLAATVPPGGDV